MIEGKAIPRKGWLIHPLGKMRCWCSETHGSGRCHTCKRYYAHIENPVATRNPMTSCRKKPAELKRKRNMNNPRTINRVNEGSITTASTTPQRFYDDDDDSSSSYDEDGNI